MQYLINYQCPNCQHEWSEIWDSACDSECPECETENITALDYEEVS